MGSEAGQATSPSTEGSAKRLISLRGRGFVVLGAGRNMGRAVAHALSEAGATVLCVDIQGEHAAKAAEDVGGIPMVADVTSQEDLQKVFDRACDEFDDFAGVVDVVGVALWKPLSDLDDEALDTQFDVNLRHVFLTLRLAKGRVRRGGTIVFISSISGLAGAPGHAAYGAAKAALVQLVKSAAVELAADGVRVNAVAPGLILTERFQARMLASPEYREIIEGNIPLRRLGDPTDIADAVLFLSSDMARYVTGHTLVVDGGITSQMQWSLPHVAATD